MPKCAQNRMLAMVLALSAMSIAVAAQSPQSTKLAPAPPPATIQPIKVGDITISGSFRTRVENWNFFNSPAADGEYTFSGSLLRLSATQKRESYDWQIEAAVPILFNLPPGSTAPPPAAQLGLGASYFAANGNQTAAANVFAKQAFIRFISSEDRATSVRFGRFEFIEGVENAQRDATLGFLKRERIAQRLVGNFGFTHVGRSFDGIEFKRDTGRSNLDFMAGRATRGVFQVDGNGELDVDILYGGFTRQIGSKENPGEWRVFGLSYHDGRRALKSDNRSAVARAADQSNIRIGTFGADYVKTKKVGEAKADLLLWAALQYGSWGILDHLAGAASIEAGIQPNMALKPWVRLGYNWTSGDSNSTDTRHGTFLEPLGTPRIYSRFPFYNHMNLKDAFAQLLLRPNSKVIIRTEYHYLQLSDPNDLWYAGGGAFSQSNFGIAGRTSGGSRELGSIGDLGLDWQFNPHVTFSAYYAHAFGGNVIKKIYPTRSDADYAYFEALYKF
ncbi:MAG: hypothetical protein JWO13_1973 [Acidobacteriales bacterium]|nr:hypothetical protein [Terriglobales bacterium]